MADPVVRVKEGSLKGKIFEAVDGRNYLAFMGVPYAEPPVGALRFKDPTPLKPWAGVRDATEESKKCAQNDVMVQIIVGDDDCLYANIVTSSLTAKRAVIVWIHGGGFATGSNNFDLYSPDYLVNKDIVFVGVNYRLGPLGFLNMDHEDCPGNQGMKDLVTALHWVKQNIEQFGGDPQNITIMGESAGSAAVHLLCISPTSKGLFHKAILQSGVAVNPWASINENKTCGFELAAALGNESKDAKEVTDFLRTISAKRIAETWEKLHPHHLFLLQLSFLPTVDSKSRNPFLPQPLSQLVSRGIDVPVLIGYNSHEGIISFLQDRPDIVQKCNDDFEATLIDYTKLTNTTVLHKMAKTLRKLYFGDGPITSDKVDNIVQYVGDVVFVNGIQEVAEIQMKKSQPTYMYRLSYVPDHTIKTYFKVKIDGACHADELSLLFHNSLLRGDNILQKGTKDYEVMEQLTQMWTNFAKIGNPIPKVDNLLTTVWPPLSKDRKNYLEIGETLVAGTNPSEETWKVWKEIYLH